MSFFIKDDKLSKRHDGDIFYKTNLLDSSVLYKNKRCLQDRDA